MNLSRYGEIEFRRRERLVQKAKSAFSWALHAKMPQSFLLEERDRIFKSEDWIRAPRPTREYIRGWVAACFEAHWRHVIFTVITERGPVSVLSFNLLVPMINQQEVSDLEAKHYPRGHAYPPEKVGDEIRWYTEPHCGSSILKPGETIPVETPLPKTWVWV